MPQSLQQEADGPHEGQAIFYIRDLVAAFGVTARALRHYEEKGLLRPGRDAKGLDRVYSRADRERVATILTAKKMGFTLREVGAMLEVPDADFQIKLDAAAINAQIQMLERQVQDINEALAQLRSMRAALSAGDQ